MHASLSDVEPTLGVGKRKTGNKPVTRIVRTDWGILLVILGLVLVGLVMVYSATYWFTLDGDGSKAGSTFFIRQAQFAALGLLMLFICSRIDYHQYRRFALPILAATILMLVVTIIVNLLSEDSLGRYLSPDKNSIQPAELAKLGAIIYIAVWLADKGDQLRSIGLGLVPFALLLGAIAGLIAAQPDVSTAVLLVVTATAMFFVAGAEMKQLLIGGLVAAVAVGVVGLFLVKVVHFEQAVVRYDRIILWINSPLSDPQDQGFQALQALGAINQGGFLGVGLGQSQQKLNVYAPHSDCIIAIIAEETGFVGVMLVMALYALWTWRGLRVAWAAVDSYGRLLGLGIVTWVTAQALLNIAVNSNTTPFTGTVLPFISSGGSSLVTGLAAVGVLLNIARVSRSARPGLSSGGDAGGWRKRQEFRS